MHHSTPGSSVLYCLPDFAQIRVHWVGDAIYHLSLCSPLLLSAFPSSKAFPNESGLCIRWPKYWRLSSSNSPSNEYSGLISFRIDWLDLLAVQGTLKSLLQHHNLKASISQHSAFFMVQFSHLYLTTGKSIATLDHKIPYFLQVCTLAYNYITYLTDYWVFSSLALSHSAYFPLRKKRTISTVGIQ